MSKRHAKKEVRRDHERRARDHARDVLRRSGSLADLSEDELEEFVCRRANNLASCPCADCRRPRYSDEGLSRVDLRRLAGRGEGIE